MICQQNQNEHDADGANVQRSPDRDHVEVKQKLKPVREANPGMKLTMSLRAEVKLLVTQSIVENSIARFLVVTINVCEPTDTAIRILEVRTLRIEQVKIKLLLLYASESSSRVGLNSFGRLGRPSVLEIGVRVNFYCSDEHQEDAYLRKINLFAGCLAVHKP